LPWISEDPLVPALPAGPSFRVILAALAALALPSFGMAADECAMVADAASSVAPQRYIVELTERPAALTGRAGGGGAAAAQRGRVRQVILAEEGRARAARGLGAPRAPDVIRHEYRVVANGFAADLLPETVAALDAHPDVRRVVPEVRVEAFLDVSVPLVRASEVWSDLGYRGAGVVVAVLDTGVDYTHADLGGCFGPSCKVIGGYDFINDDADPMDDHGHGTHCAATAAGDGVLLGVAPDAEVLAYKVLNVQGFGGSSGIIAGIERAADPDDDGDPSDHADVVSMSLGGPGDEDDPMSLAIDAATEAGVLSVISAGNNARYFSVGSPGTARTALTVGATNDDDLIAGFSSRGPTIPAALLKPEITAPGVGICAARLPTAYVSQQCIDTAHATLSGTSMAAPHVAGAAALLRGFDPVLSPAEAKAILQQASEPVGLDPTTGGSGRLDARAALDARTVVLPAPLNLGLDDATQPVWERTETVTVRNLDAAPRTYDLTFDDSDLPPGVTAEIVPDQVLVPGGGAADVSLTVTVDNAVVPPSTAAPYLHVGRVVATTAGEERATPVSFALHPPLANDLCQSAIELGPGGYGTTAFTAYATTSANDPESTCGCGVNSHSVWYRVTPEQNGTVYLSPADSGYTTVLGVFSGGCNNLRPVACNAVEAGFDLPLTFEAKAGVSYYVEVTSFCSSPAGRLHLILDVPGPRPVLTTPLTEIFRAGRNDLAGTRLVFTPGGASYDVCLEFADDYPTDPAGGTELPLTSESYLPIQLAGGESVSLYGEHYDELFVGASGYVSFTAGATDSGPSFGTFFDLPRVAPFSARMLVSPFNLGDVSWKQVADRVAVTWDGIQNIEPEEFIAYPLNSFQLEMLFDGQIRMTFLETGWHGITGLSAGGGAPPLFETSNFIAVPHCRAPAGGEVPLAGKKITFKDRAFRPETTKFNLKIMPGPAVLPQPGGAADPTSVGATLELYNRQTGEFATLPLPAAGWELLQAGNGSISYRYRDRDALFGPCSGVDVADRAVKVKCKRAELGFSLDELRQLTFSASLLFGSPSTGTRYCTAFGGTIKKDLRGSFVAKNAPAPDRCRLPESSYP
jgi:subtilisin family serine protease